MAKIVDESMKLFGFGRKQPKSPQPSDQTLLIMNLVMRGEWEHLRRDFGRKELEKAAREMMDYYWSQQNIR